MDIHIYPEAHHAFDIDGIVLYEAGYRRAAGVVPILGISLAARDDALASVPALAAIWGSRRRAV